jgi:hypothetical protein
MELIIRNPELPSEVGKAKIFFDEKCKVPERQKENLILPLRQGNRLIPFEGREVFLFCGTDTRTNAQTLYFGGTDEEPFLVRLNPEAGKFFNEGGEDGFIEALKPPIVKQAESLFMKTARRQGDIFAVPTLFCWKTVQLMAALGLGDSVPIHATVEDQSSVFGTRHLFTGERMDLKVHGKTFEVAEGIVEAPDHASMELTFPHILAQTAYLWDPPDAD